MFLISTTAPPKETLNIFIKPLIQISPKWTGNSHRTQVFKGLVQKGAV